jgi:DNA-binding NarL/FixJ family response regulator
VADALRTINPNVRIIVSSGYSEEEVTSRMGGMRVSGFIQKPYRLKSLLAIVGTVAQ